MDDVEGRWLFSKKEIQKKNAETVDSMDGHDQFSFKGKLGGGFQTFFIFTPIWGRFPF